MNPTSGMFKKIKSIFVIEDQNASSGGTENEKNIENDTPVTRNNPVDEASRKSIDGKPDTKFVDLLLKAIEANNLEGFDYLEYKNSLNSVINVIQDETLRYKSSFEIAKTMGLTKEKLISSANHYLQILSAEEKKFKEALENQKAKQIHGRADQITSIEKGINENKKKIEQLNKDIELATQQLGQVRSEIDEAVIKIDQTNQQFGASFGLVYNQIFEDIEKIKANI